jgi:2,4-dienoyl-CoA reductase-like NADH-dependent reductase (Old Yellow Enzyme family)
MNAMDYVQGGLTLEDAVEIAQALQRMEVNALSVTSGTMCESVPFCLSPAGTPEANLLPMAARIKESVSLPVIAAGRIRDPGHREESTGCRGYGPDRAQPAVSRRSRLGAQGPDRR